MSIKHMHLNYRHLRINTFNNVRKKVIILSLERKSDKYVAIEMQVVSNINVVKSIALDIEPWEVSVIDTGLNTLTRGIIKRIKEYVNNEAFMITYGDAVCDVDINELLRYHKSHGKISIIISMIQTQQKGGLYITKYGVVLSYREKNMIMRC